MRESREALHHLVVSALFAAAVAVATACLLHIPLPTGGYLHLGDALIYLGACLLPTPWAMAAGAVGAGLADLLTAPMWALPTVLIKPLLCLLFTSRDRRLLCPRNAAALFAAGLLSPTLYGLAGVLLSGTVSAFLPQFLGTLTQAAGSGLAFAVLAGGADRVGLKRRLTAK